MKNMHWTSILGLCLILLGTVFSFLGTYFSDEKSQEELTTKIQEKNQTIESINSNNKKLIDQNTALLNSNDNVSNSNGELISQNQKMLSKIENYQKDIEAKEKKIRDLEEKVKKAERGIVSIIQFDGSYLVKQGGSTKVTGGTEENKNFKRLVKLDEEKKFAEIIILCDKSIKASPEWYTAYFFKAFTLYNLDKKNKEKSIELLEFLERNTYGDSQYALRIAEFYSHMGEKKKADELLKTIPKEVLQDLINSQKRREQGKK